MISFTENPQQDLQPDNIQVTLAGINQQFTIEKLDNSSYSLSITFAVNINQGDKLLVNFTKPIVSVFNSILATQSLEIELFADSSNAEASAINQAKDSRTGCYLCWNGSSIWLKFNESRSHYFL